MTAINGADAREYLRRWREVEQVQKALDRQQPIELRLRQLSALMSSRALFGTDPAREAEVEQVRQRWIRIRAFVGG